MITCREPTFEEQTKIIRSIKSRMVTALTFGAVMFSLGMVGLWRGKTILGYGFAILGLGWLVVAMRSRMHVRAMQSEITLSSRDAR